MTTPRSTYYNYTYRSDGVKMHRYYVRDYLGSVRAVFDLYGNLEQTNDYNITGIPSSRHLGNADVHKHTGKEFQGFNGLAWYDNNARYYDPILARFTTQDPLAEKYPWLSPYNHCANNPLRYTDKDGRILRDENGEIVYLTDGTMAEFEHPSGSKAQLEVGYVFANNFTPIVVFNNISDDIEWDTNCHGTSFIEGKYWLNNDQVNSLLEGDNYISIPIKKAQKGDIVLFHGDSRNEHSMTILETNGRINETEVEGIEGLGTSIVTRSFKNAWDYPNNSMIVRKSEIDVTITNEIINTIKQVLYE